MTKDRRTIPYIIASLLLAFAPFYLNRYQIDVLNTVGLYALLGLSLNLIVGHAGLFNKRALLEVQTRRIGVGGQQREALAQGQSALASGKDSLAPQAAHDTLAAEILGIAVFGKALTHVFHGFAFCFAAGQKLDVALGEGFHFLTGFGIRIIPDALGFVGE